MIKPGRLGELKINSPKMNYKIVLISKKSVKIAHLNNGNRSKLFEEHPIY